MQDSTVLTQITPEVTSIPVYKDGILYKVESCIIQMPV